LFSIPSSLCSGDQSPSSQRSDTMRSSATAIGFGGLLLAVLLVQAHASFSPMTTIPSNLELSDQLCQVATTAGIPGLPSVGFCEATRLTESAEGNPMCGFLNGAEMAIASLFRPEGAAQLAATLYVLLFPACFWSGSSNTNLLSNRPEHACQLACKLANWHVRSICNCLLVLATVANHECHLCCCCCCPCRH
jgi:hypothetical protein